MENDWRYFLFYRVDIMDYVLFKRSYITKGLFL